MTASVNGLDLLGASITEPRVGAWTAELELDGDEALSGQVTILIDGAKWVGTVLSGDTYAGRVQLRVVGGAGKLANELDAKFYVGVTLGTVIGEIMRATGETLASDTTAAVRSHSVPRWTRSQARAGQALTQIADELKVAWRVKRDGTIWLGAETWPAAKVEYEEIDRQPAQNMCVIAPEVPILQPGTTFLGTKVARVTTTVRDGALRQDVVFEPKTPGKFSGFMADLAAIVESMVGNRIDYSRVYEAKVVKQAGDDTLELLVDHPKMRGSGITKVPIAHGIPGLRVKVPGGVRVRLFFDNGDPKRPTAALWPDGSSVTEISIAAPTIKITGNLEVTGEVTAKSATTPVKLSTHLHPTGMGPSGAPTPGT